MSAKIFVDSNSIFINEEQKQLVKNCLCKIGKEVLISTKKLPTGEYKSRWNRERIDTSALGYNDAQQLVVFSSNIPTYSVTAFWANGKFSNYEWKGLFQRTNKD